MFFEAARDTGRRASERGFPWDGVLAVELRADLEPIGDAVVAGLDVHGHRRADYTASPKAISGGEGMARKTVLVSDLSGDEIEDGQGAKVRITFDDARRGVIEMDVTANEAKAMGAKGRAVARRGRKPKGA
jgi:hypothetical protein